MFSFLT
jgi:putative transcription factor